MAGNGWSICKRWRRCAREGTRGRRFVSKLSDSEAEAAETQVWLEFAVKCSYLSPATSNELSAAYDNVLGKLVNMISHLEQWRIR